MKTSSSFHFLRVLMVFGREWGPTVGRCCRLSGLCMKAKACGPTSSIRSTKRSMSELKNSWHDMTSNRSIRKDEPEVTKG